MTTNSCLYHTRVMHHRLTPGKYRLDYDVSLFYLDLAELDRITHKLHLLGRNGFNLFNFRDKDHLRLDGNGDTKTQISLFLQQQGINWNDGRIMLLTDLRALGRQLNPLSLYFCFDKHGQPVCTVAEIADKKEPCKLYLLDLKMYASHRFQHRFAKQVTPSNQADLGTQFDFDLGVPGKKLSLRIDDINRNGDRFFISILKGSRKPLSDARLLRYFFSIPFISLKITTLVHWQIGKLAIKRLYLAIARTLRPGRSSKQSAGGQSNFVS